MSGGSDDGAGAVFLRANALIDPDHTAAIPV
jgi:hypothetical protein